MGDCIDGEPLEKTKVLTIRPGLHCEPNATYYLRTARGYRFILEKLETLLGREEAESVSIPGRGNLVAALKEVSLRCYGAYLVTCADLGMPPSLPEEELAQEDLASAKDAAVSWLEHLEEDPVLKRDIRCIVPVMVSLQEGRARYWACVGGARGTFEGRDSVAPPAIRFSGLKNRRGPLARKHKRLRCFGEPTGK